MQWGRGGGATRGPPCHAIRLRESQRKPDWLSVYPPCQEEGWQSVRFFVSVAWYTTAHPGLHCWTFQTTKAECSSLTFSLLIVDCLPGSGTRSLSLHIGQEINLHKLAGCRQPQFNDPLSFHVPFLSSLSGKTLFVRNGVLVLACPHANCGEMCHLRSLPLFHKCRPTHTPWIPEWANIGKLIGWQSAEEHLSIACPCCTVTREQGAVRGRDIPLALILDSVSHTLSLARNERTPLCDFIVETVGKISSSTTTTTTAKTHCCFNQVCYQLTQILKHYH